MSIKDKYKVISVKIETVKEWFLKKHYAKRLPMCSFCFALLNDKNITVGVCSFGQTPSIQLNQSLSDGKFDVIELNRLITNDDLEKNTASFFVSQCLKLIPKPKIIVSFADISKNHNGYIYQATNWIYTGLNAERYEWKSKSNPNMHYRNIAERYVGVDKNDVDDLYKQPLSRKHRYVYFLGNKKQKKIMKKNIKLNLIQKGKTKTMMQVINRVFKPLFFKCTNLVFLRLLTTFGIWKVGDFANINFQLSTKFETSQKPLIDAITPIFYILCCAVVLF